MFCKNFDAERWVSLIFSPQTCQKGCSASFQLFLWKHRFGHFVLLSHLSLVSIFMVWFAVFGHFGLFCMLLQRWQDKQNFTAFSNSTSFGKIFGSALVLISCLYFHVPSTPGRMVMKSICWWNGCASYHQQFYRWTGQKKREVDRTKQFTNDVKKRRKKNLKTRQHFFEPHKTFIGPLGISTHKTSQEAPYSLWDCFLLRNAEISSLCQVYEFFAKRFLAVSSYHHRVFQVSSVR